MKRGIRRQRVSDVLARAVCKVVVTVAATVASVHIHTCSHTRSHFHCPLSLSLVAFPPLASTTHRLHAPTNMLFAH